MPVKGKGGAQARAALRPGVRWVPPSGSAQLGLGLRTPAAKPAVKRLPRVGPSESDTQIQGFAWFKYRALPLDATLRANPNGIWFGDTARDPASGKTMRRTPAEMARIAATTRKMKSEGWTIGTPDTVATWQGMGLWVELKAEDATPSDLDDDQLREILALLDSGCRVGIARTIWEWEDLYLGWGVPLRRRYPDRPPEPRLRANAIRWPIEGERLREVCLRLQASRRKARGQAPLMDLPAPRATTTAGRGRAGINGKPEEGDAPMTGARGIRKRAPRVRAAAPRDAEKKGR
jgi:hypothetical protein